MPALTQANEWYLEDLSENIRAVFDVKRRSGQYIGSFPVYGYRKDPQNHNRLLIDEPAARVVHSIYAMCLAGMGRQRIAGELNRRGVLNPTAYKQEQGLDYVNGAQREQDGLWNRTTVGRILKNPLYLGDMVQGVRKKASYKSKRLLTVPPEEWVVVPGTHAPVVERETFEEVQRLLGERTRAGGTGQVHPLAGRVRCMDCGSAMLKYTNTYRGRKRSYLRCKRCSQGRCTSHAIRLDLLEARIRALLEGHLARCDASGLRILPPSAREDGTRQKELERLRAEIARRVRAAKDLYLDKAEGLISAEQFRELNNAYQEERKALEARAARLEQDRDRAPALCPQGPLRLDTLPRSLTVLAVKTVEIGERDKATGRQNVRITWNF